MQDHFGVGKRLLDLGLDAVTDGVSADERERGIELDMELDELGESGGSLLKVMAALLLFVRRHEVHDALAIGIAELAVHKHVERTAADLPGAEQEIERDQGGDDGVDDRQLEPRRQ